MDSNTTELQAAVTINDGPAMPGVLIIEQRFEVVFSDRATKPDPTWEHTDGAGHFHAYDRDGKLPTLTPRSRHVDCDGSCGGVCGGEGYDVTDYLCSVCDELVEPGRVDDRGPRRIDTGKDWQVKVRGRAPVTGDKVTVKAVVRPDTMMFGVAKVGGFEGNFEFDRADVTTTLYSAGPLDTRAIHQAAVAA